MQRIALGILLLLGQSLAVVSGQVATRQPNLELGREIYNFHCYFCHGYSGDAATLAATYLDPKPRNFQNTSVDSLSREAMLEAITRGRPGTAMLGFSERLSTKEIEAVVDFLRDEFMTSRRENTRYHTPENGWDNHERYSAAFTFATGELPLDTPWANLDEQQMAGKRLFLSSCITCHDHARVENPGAIWSGRPLSYPRAGYTHRQANDVDGVSAASPYAVHDNPPELPLDAGEAIQRGARLFFDNCAFCHAADGTGKNWIGRFMEPHPRDLTDPAFMRTLSETRLREVIHNGLPGTSMPAWKDVLDERQVAALVRYVDRVLHPLASD